ncbi:expressed unknown protein [Seminavis robusta]|uniref:Uncharacterized protein n=1 Tax=Seminavis robusta TaxID=568900 RepID=A0A9N8DID2_9STRA|nr:expressed unknown protein [Seminavis robusta]|eukprot:Sro79_g042870.1 n/a (187) ;mRNA; r:105845-106485
MMKLLSFLLVALAASNVHSFSPMLGTSRSVVRSETTSLQMAKGFGAEKTPKREKSAGQTKRDSEAAKYDELAASGGQEYLVYVRQFGSDDQSWFPCGSIAVPRGAQVTDAIYANEEALKVAIMRTYPKLEGLEQEFEFGYNLKIYPDDPVEVAAKGGKKTEGLSVGNWLSLLLSPVDASQSKPPSS